MDEQQIWQVEEGETRSAGIIHIVITALLIGIGAVVGAFGSFSLPLGFGVNFFWPAIAVQNVGGIWFGAWGVIAASLFPIISNGITGTPVYVSLAYIPANLVQALLPMLAFRYFKADPRLNSKRDWIVFLASITLGNIFGALYSPLVVLKGFGLLTAESVPVFIWGWFGGNEVAGIIFGVILLKALSNVVITTNAFVKRWFA
ncbi:MAG TPA: hypothetical protein G4N98_10430 [Thermoflexia bacterium]|nr:hypothetical protein [Thermoflexia bacterium]